MILLNNCIMPAFYSLYYSKSDMEKAFCIPLNISFLLIYYFEQMITHHIFALIIRIIGHLILAISLEELTFA